MFFPAPEFFFPDLYPIYAKWLYQQKQGGNVYIYQKAWSESIWKVHRSGIPLCKGRPANVQQVGANRDIRKTLFLAILNAIQRAAIVFEAAQKDPDHGKKEIDYCARK